jgi:uncharacterized protein (DUF885 family)
MDLHNKKSATPKQLSALAADIYESLAHHFPVCLASDEFHYFPQFMSDRHDGSRWDNFSPDGVVDVLALISSWTRQLDTLSRNQLSDENSVDIEVLQQVLSTLREQLEVVRVHHHQPTFYLTIIGIGLADALTEGPGVFRQRVRTLPGFIEQAISNLQRIPRLFRELGCEMSTKMSAWLGTLDQGTGSTSRAVDALDKLTGYLKQIPLTEDFRLDPDLYARIADRHMGTHMGLDQITDTLDREIRETRALLEKEARSIGTNKSWQRVVQEMPAATAEAGGKPLYHAIIAELKDHCTKEGFIDQAFADKLPVGVQIIPEHLRPVRSGAAFSMPPGHPARGGVFYIQPGIGGAVPRDYRLLAAHETFPGHQLLDAHRWNLPNPLRRPIEFPIYYEGWANFSEEILFDTGFFKGPIDRLLLARRRFRRAIRGRTDLKIHTGQLTLEEAASVMVKNGFEAESAASMVKRYALKPGYQLAYTIGRSRFHDLYKGYLDRGGTTAEFVRAVLQQGEIGFDHLAGCLAIR